MFAQEGENMQEHTCDWGINFGSGLFKYTIDVITEIVVDIHYGGQCQLTNADIRCPNRANNGGVTSHQASSGACMALKGSKKRRSLKIDVLVPLKAIAGTVAKRATGSRTVGNQGETKKVKPPNGGNPRQSQTNPRKIK